MDSVVGYVLVLSAVLLIRQVIVGRVAQTPQDLKDLTVALLDGNTAAASTVLSQRRNNIDGVTLTGTKGTGLAGALAGVTPSVVDGPQISSSSNTLLAVMKTLGSNAKGYAKGATGPDYYDCSGLVYRALFQMGIYKGPRFWTGSFDSIAGRFATQVKSPMVGDIAIWVYKHHMGVVDGQDSIYSARSPEKGIGSVSLSGDVQYFDSVPEYWRLKP